MSNVHDFDYYDASQFYSELPVRNCFFYSVFGGCPYVLENPEADKSVTDNIIRFLLPETGIIGSHIDNIILKEIRKSFDAWIQELQENGRKKIL